MSSAFFIQIRCDLCVMRSHQAQHLLTRSSCLYLTTFGPNGQSGTVPVWFFVRQGAIYFCTQANSLKIRRIRRNPYVCVRLGKRKPWDFNCQARIIEDDADLQSILTRTYRRRYPLRWLLLGSRIKQRLMCSQEVIVELTPTDTESQRLLLELA
jgi:PPOX class probable F420-dependent enzyme